MVRITSLVLAAGLFVSGCGGGGGGAPGTGGSGSGDTSVVDHTLQVSVTFPQQSLSLFQPAQVQPTLSGFQGYTPACALVSGQIPPGMQLNGNCTIAGTPTAQGNYGFTLRVSAAGVSNTLDFGGGIGVVGPGIQYPPAAGSLVVGSSVSSAPTLSWWPSPVPGATWNYAVTSGTLAPGLSLDAASGAITGTLTTQGTFTAQISALLTTPMGTYQTGTTSFGVAVDVPSISYPKLATQNAAGDSLLFVGQAMALQVQASPSDTVAGFSLASGSLPSGLALDAGTGLVSGVPAAVTPPTDFEVQATVTRSGVGSLAQAGSRLEVRLPGQVVYPSGVSVPVNATFNTISPVWVPDPAMTSPFSFTATYAPKPGACTLPAGVTVSSNGWVDGHPTATGSFQCTIVVTYTANGVQWSGDAALNLDVQ